VHGRRQVRSGRFVGSMCRGHCWAALAVWHYPQHVLHHNSRNRGSCSCRMCVTSEQSWRRTAQCLHAESPQCSHFSLDSKGLGIPSHLQGQPSSRGWCCSNVALPQADAATPFYPVLGSL
jgi:hypothetical protein